MINSSANHEYSPVLKGPYLNVKQYNWASTVSDHDTESILINMQNTTEITQHRDCSTKRKRGRSLKRVKFETKIPA